MSDTDLLSLGSTQSLDPREGVVNGVLGNQSYVSLDGIESNDYQNQSAKHVLHLRPHPRLRPILGPGHFVHDLILIPATPLRVVSRSRRTLADHFRLPLIGAVTPHPRFYHRELSFTERTRPYRRR